MLQVQFTTSVGSMQPVPAGSTLQYCPAFNCAHPSLYVDAVAAFTSGSQLAGLFCLQVDLKVAWQQLLLASLAEWLA
jgi:hypothetical protein